jgi:hypothetical protein
MKPFIAVCIAVVVLFIQAPAFAAPSYLGMCHKDWNCRGMLASWNGSETIVTGWLENTFGAECSCANELLATPAAKIIRVHLSNSPCMRNKRCGRSELLYGETKASASRKILSDNKGLWRKFARTTQRFKNRLEAAHHVTQCYVSPCLECDLNAKARNRLLSYVRDALPTCIPVDNPYGQRCLKGYVCEKHGVNPSISGSCIVDLDGIDGAKVDVKKWVERYRHCALAFYWEPFMNCIRSDKFVLPMQRNCKYDSSIFDYIKGILCQYFLPPSSATCSL